MSIAAVIWQMQTTDPACCQIILGFVTWRCCKC